MRRLIIFPIACLIALPAVLFAESNPQRVYQWTDANGVVHYTQLEPDKVQSKARDLHTPDPAVTAAPATPKMSNQSACDMARLNHDKLAGAKPGQLTTDKDGDGKPELMNADDIKAAQDLDEVQIKAYCKG